MIQSVLLIARIASCPIQLGRRCAPAGQSVTVRYAAQALALLNPDADLATALAPTVSVTPWVPANARWPHLVA
jgi:hypothetical protein